MDKTSTLYSVISGLSRYITGGPAGFFKSKEPTETAMDDAEEMVGQISNYIIAAGIVMSVMMAVDEGKAYKSKWKMTKAIIQAMDIMDDAVEDEDVERWKKLFGPPCSQ